MNRIWTSVFGKKDAVVAAPIVTPVVPVAPRRTINPIFPLLCLGLILFLIASTIVLALIPVYLQSRDIGRANPSSAQFSTNLLLRNGFLPVGTLSSENCARIQAQIRQQAAASNRVRPSVPSVQSCTVLGNSTTTGRRRRQQNQPLGNLINVVVVLPPANCPTNFCIISRALALINILLNLGDFNILLVSATGSDFNFVASFISASDVTLVSTPSGTGTTATTPVTPLDTNFYGITNDSRLLLFSAANPGTVLASNSITNLNSGDIITNIDFRPATGQLYGTSNRQLYIINEDTGVARAIGPNLDSSVTGNIVSMEFDPVFDVLRYVTDQGINVSIDPEEGLVFYSPSRPNSTETGISVAYNNNVAGATTTSLFTIDPNADVLLRLDQQNGATNTQVGSGLGVNITSGIGFDISPTGVPLACVQIGSTIVLYLVDLNSGTFSQRLGEVTQPIISLAIATAPVAYAVLTNGSALLYVNFLNSAFQTTSKTITGLRTGESFVSIDMRPFNGQLFGVTSQSRLYLLNMGTAELYDTNNGNPFTPPIRGSNFAIDFNPQVDRLRVVTDQGQNFVLNPNTGLVQSTNNDLNPSNITITSIAYSNNVPNASSTTLYDIATTLNQLYIQNTPNNGTLILVGSLGITIGVGNGFDIGSKSGNAFGLFTVNGVTSIYNVSLSTGAATRLFDNVLSSDVISYTLGLNA